MVLNIILQQLVIECDEPEFILHFLEPQNLLVELIWLAELMIEVFYLGLCYLALVKATLRTMDITKVIFKD